MFDLSCLSANEYLSYRSSILSMLSPKESYEIVSSHVRFSRTTSSVKKKKTSKTISKTVFLRFFLHYENKHRTLSWKCVRLHVFVLMPIQEVEAGTASRFRKITSLALSFYFLFFLNLWQLDWNPTIKITFTNFRIVVKLSLKKNQDEWAPLAWLKRVFRTRLRITEQKRVRMTHGYLFLRDYRKCKSWSQEYVPKDSKKSRVFWWYSRWTCELAIDRRSEDGECHRSFFKQIWGKNKFYLLIHKIRANNEV